ncbi:NAD(P)-binding protein [Aspergillus sclerotioniger CBS 115572]|uniref:NAD(P)-binding protein n=1 Tax=Aspergillus sclerotioniger CBS 115572 TaxID=1450535 RepID=A0A317V1Y4_9EURO|nr:NAD(P)-binding protein [Aspergillus sclerotioniger CBS 115572]PWY66807.1 NAD(P)-binding protein [Aspergillus sclerotioniger CBS 115572]
MSPPQTSVLITGCSNNSLGASLALAFHARGLKVYATGRNPAKLTQCSLAGITTLTLDVLSPTSITAAISQLPSLDILVNNAGANLHMPISDLSLPAAKELFDLNVWSYLAMTQACLPLLLKSETGGMVVNQTSLAMITVLPFQGAYSASKAAISVFSETMRMELGVLGVRVVELRTGLVRSNLIEGENGKGRGDGLRLPSGSVYEGAKEVVERAMRQEEFRGKGMDRDVWAGKVVGDLLKKKKRTPKVVWRGESVWIAKVVGWLPVGWCDWLWARVTGLDVVEGVLGRDSKKDV